MPFEPRHTGARQGRAPFLRFPIGQKELAILRRLKPMESQITPGSAFRRGAFSAGGAELIFGPASNVIGHKPIGE
jgi:hypothetical protein